MKVGTVSFAVGSGRLVRRAGSVLFDASGKNSDLVAGFDSAVSDDDAFALAKQMLAASGLSLAPFAVVRWGESVDLLAFGDVAIATSTAIAPMISGASSATWVEHHLDADYIKSEGSIGIWSGEESEVGTNLRLGVAACAGFRVDLVPAGSNLGVHDDGAFELSHDASRDELAEHDELEVEPHAASETPALDPNAVVRSAPIEDSRTDDLVGFAAVQAIVGDVPAPASPVSESPANAVEVVSANESSDDAAVADDEVDFFGSFEPGGRGNLEYTEIQMSSPADDLIVDSPVVDDDVDDVIDDDHSVASFEIADVFSEADEPAPAPPVPPAAPPEAPPLPPEFTESKMLAADESAATTLCERGHSNPADSAMCFTCGGEMVSSVVVADGQQPVSGWLVFDDGTEVAVDRMLIIGRKPATFDASSQAVVIDHPEVSRSHAQVEVQGWAVMLTDLGSRNGTWVSRPGAETERLDAGEPRVLETGTTVLLGAPDASFTYRVDRT